MTRSRVWQIIILAAAIFVAITIDRGIRRFRDGSKARPIPVQEAGVAPAPVYQTPPAATVAVVPQSKPTSLSAKRLLSTILAERDPRQRINDLEAFINALSESEFADALKGIRKIPRNSERELASRLLVARWVQVDPEAALTFASANRGFEYIADDVFQAEAALDLQSALSRAKNIDDSDLRYMALRGVLSFIADTNPAAALGLAQSLGEFPGNEPLSSVIYRQWATNDPESAALQAAQNSVDGNPWRSPVAQVARTWAAQDPMAAANWAISLSDPNTEAHTISQVMRQWGRQDVAAAADWVNSLPAGASYDSAAAGLAFSMAANDPKDAVAWAGNIGNDAVRTEALQRVSREVMWRNPTDGAAILQAAGVPPNLIPPPRQGGR